VKKFIKAFADLVADLILGYKSKIPTLNSGPAARA